MKRTLALGLILVVLATALACREVEVSSSEREMFVRGHDLAEATGLSIEDSVKYEKFTKTKYFDGTVQVEYEFEPPIEKSATYMYGQISIELKKTDAKISRVVEDSTVGLVLKAQGLEKVEIPDFYKYGDSSVYYALKKDGETVGNYFSAVEGGKVFSLMIAGVYVDDPDIWRELVEPKLKLFSAYKGN